MGPCVRRDDSFYAAALRRDLFAEPERIREQIETIIGLDARDAILCSAKQGIGVHDILEAIVHLVPPPKGSIDAPLRALIFDSWFDSYRGVIILTRVLDGRLRLGQKIRLWSNGQQFDVEAQVARVLIDAFFTIGQQVQEHRAEARLAQRARNVLVARTVPAAAAAVCEQDHPGRRIRYR